MRYTAPHNQVITGPYSSQSFWYAVSPPISAEQKTTSTATVINDLKRESKYTLSYTWNKTLANQVKLTLREVSASGYYLARLY